MRKKRGQSFAVEFGTENVIVCATNASGDSLMIQLYVSLPGGATKPEDAATAHVLPLATLEEIFTENGDIISGYTLSSSLASAAISSDGSKWKDLFLGGGAVIGFGFMLALVLCLGLVAYKWNKKKRQAAVLITSMFDYCVNISYSVQVAPWQRTETPSSFKLSSLGEQSFGSATDTDMASMENHGRQSSAGDLESCHSVDSHDAQEEWPWLSPTSLAPLAIPNKPIPVWINR